MTGAAMRYYEFATRRWARMKNYEAVVECWIVSVRHGWNWLGYEVQLAAKGQVVYRSTRFLNRKLADDEADALFRTFFVGTDPSSVPSGGAGESTAAARSGQCSIQGSASR